MAAAEKDLRATPLVILRGQIKGKHFALFRGAIFVRARIKQRLQVVGLTEPRGEHENGHALVVWKIVLQRFRRKRCQEFLVALVRQNGVGVRATREQCVEERPVVGCNCVSQKRNACRPSRVGGEACLPSRSRTWSWLPFARAASRASGTRGPLFCGGKRCKIESTIFRLPASKASPRRSDHGRMAPSSAAKGRAYSVAAAFPAATA